jgi:hypothetical protein
MITFTLNSQLSAVNCQHLLPGSSHSPFNRIPGLHTYSRCKTALNDNYDAHQKHPRESYDRRMLQFVAGGSILRASPVPEFPRHHPVITFTPD